MTDKELRQKVIDALDWEPSVNAKHIGVSVDSGVVTLTGHVSTYGQKLTAESVVKRIKGVKGIAQDLSVRWLDHDPSSDDDICKRAVTALGLDIMLPEGAVQVRVAQGWVTLTGEVPWQYQRAAAEADLRNLRGVVGITNNIVLKPQTSVADIEKRIKTALARDGALDAEAIRVSVMGDRVTLEGRVDCWRDRDLVERTVWAAPGVRAITDNLRVA